VALLALLSGCSVDEVFAFGWPQGGISDQSQRMFDMWIGSVIAALAVGFFVWGLIFWCVIRYRKRGDELPPQTATTCRSSCSTRWRRSSSSRALLLHRGDPDRGQQDHTQPGRGGRRDRVQWNWEFAYEGQLGTDGKPVNTTGTTTVVPILVVPTGKRIRFVEHSPDVIHSFWVRSCCSSATCSPATWSTSSR